MLELLRLADSCSVYGCCMLYADWLHFVLHCCIFWLHVFLQNSYRQFAKLLVHINELVSGLESGVPVLLACRDPSHRQTSPWRRSKMSRQRNYLPLPLSHPLLPWQHQNFQKIQKMMWKYLTTKVPLSN